MKTEYDYDCYKNEHYIIGKMLNKKS